VAGAASLVTVAAIVAILYLLDAYPIPTIYDSAGLVDVLFVPLVLTLAIGVGSLPALLSLRPVVYLGYISFSLYMVHELVHTTWNWMVLQFELQLGSDLAGKAVLLSLIAAAFAGAVLLYHFIEEPARQWMRGMMSPPHRSRADIGKLQTIDGQRVERAPVVSARAG
jgi:peptidoglycan/LPS O-acetylase OafA/YrhL